MKFNYYKLEDICDLQIGKTPRREINEYWGRGYSWVSISDMKSSVVNTTREEITEKAVKECGCKKVTKGTLLLSFKLSIGKLAFAEKDLFTNEAIVALSIKDPMLVLPKYLYYALKHTPLIGSNNAAMGCTLNKESLRLLKVPVPANIKDQVYVSEILSKAESLISQRKESLRLLDEFLKSTFLEMFISNGKFKYWGGLCKIKGLVESEKNSIKAGPFGSSMKKEYYVQKGYKIYGQEQVIADDLSCGEYYIDQNLYEKLESCKIKEGDVLISLVGTYGKISIVPTNFEPGIINPRLMKISFNKSKIHPIYFKFLFKSDFIQHSLAKLSRGGTMDILNVGIIKELEIPTPPLSLQNQFIEIVKKTDKLKSHLNKCLS